MFVFLEQREGQVSSFDINVTFEDHKKWELDPEEVRQGHGVQGAVP